MNKYPQVKVGVILESKEGWRIIVQYIKDDFYIVAMTMGSSNNIVHLTHDDLAGFSVIEKLNTSEEYFDKAEQYKRAAKVYHTLFLEMRNEEDCIISLGKNSRALRHAEQLASELTLVRYINRPPGVPYTTKKA